MFNTPFLMIDQFELNCLIQKNEIFQKFDLRSEDLKAYAQARPVLQKDGSRAMISIDGVMMANPSILDRIFMSAVSTIDLIQAVGDVYNDKNVKTVVFNMNTVGGEVTKLNVLSQAVYELSKVKQTASVNTGVMASAGYRVASQTSHIFSDDAMNRTGSIGTYMQLFDTSKAFEKQGVEVTHIATGPFKGLPSQGVPISADMKAYAMDLAKEMQAGFDSEVLRMRQGVDLSEGSEAKSGKAFTFEKSLELGLIDGMKSISEAFELLEAKNKVNMIRSRQ